ncbi:hypothetical protein BLAT2472_60125 [Burkholderia latens]
MRKSRSGPAGIAQNSGSVRHRFLIISLFRERPHSIIVRPFDFIRTPERLQKKLCEKANRRVPRYSKLLWTSPAVTGWRG